jgi:branched-chain amino acid transport system substrate-binding protein
MRTRHVLIASLLFAVSSVPAVPVADNIRIADIDAFSGPFANVGESFLAHVRMSIDSVNAGGGVLGGSRLELVAFDGKGNPQDSLLALQQAIDQGIRIVVQASGSAVAGASLEAVAKHNARYPDRAVLYINYGALDPALTESRCNFWHFRFDEHGHMKMEVFTSALAARKDVKKVFLINQDYAWGQSVSRDAREMIARKRPDIEIVGDDMHPLGKVKDFAPYIAKIKASGADAVVTGNWGNDLSLLVKAGKDAGLKADYYSVFAYMQGTPTAMGEAGVDRVRTLVAWHANVQPNPMEKYANEFKARYKQDWYWLPARFAIEMLARAIDQAGSADPLKVARALEGMKYMSPIGEVWMRADDHQLIHPLYLAAFAKAGQSGVKYDAESTGFGWKTEARIEAKDTVLPTACKMERP